MMNHYKYKTFAILIACFLCLSATPRQQCLEVFKTSAEAIESKFRTQQNSIRFEEIPVTAGSLLAAHRTGFLPERAGDWQRPEKRGVILLENQKIATSSRQAISKAIANETRVTWNESIDDVIRMCAGMVRGENNFQWMTKEVVDGYIALARLGYVYSIELRSKHGSLIAGSFGMVSESHWQGVSKFRDMTDPLSNGAGHVLDSAEKYFLWSKGLKMVDVEVATFNDGRPKPGVLSISGDDFARFLSEAHSSQMTFFEGSQAGEPLPAFQSDFYEVFQSMREKQDYQFQK